MLIFINANRICKVHIIFTHGQLYITRNCDSEHIQNTFIFAFDENILEKEAEKPIQILDYSQVLSYLNRLRKYEVLMVQSITLKTPKTCLVRDIAKMT